MDKQALRGEIRLRRAALSDGYKKLASRAIADRLAAMERVQRARKLMCFYPLRGEPDLRIFMEKFVQNGGELYLPSVCGNEMSAVRWEPGQTLVKAECGTMQPPFEKTDARPDVVITPGMAFDGRGARLGMGGGYYDRFFAENPAIRIGVAFDEFVCEHIEMYVHDVYMDAVVSDKRLYILGKMI